VTSVTSYSKTTLDNYSSISLKMRPKSHFNGRLSVESTEIKYYKNLPQIFGEVVNLIDCMGSNGSNVTQNVPAEYYKACGNETICLYKKRPLPKNRRATKYKARAP